MKYIVLEVADSLQSGDWIREVPFVFPDGCSHSEVAKAMTRMLRAERPDGRDRKIRPVSAGFISSMTFTEPCSGASVSMSGLKSRGKQDERLLLMYDYTHGHL